MRTALVVAALCLLCNAGAQAEMYKWTDADGKTHFGDQPPPDAQLEDIKGTVNGYSSTRAVRERADSAGNSAGDSITMYSAQWCGVCKTAKRYMQQQGIAFTELDIDRSQRANRAWKKLGGTGVPLIVVNGRIMNGFSASGLEELRNK